MVAYYCKNVRTLATIGLQHVSIYTTAYDGRTYLTHKCARSVYFPYFTSFLIVYIVCQLRDAVEKSLPIFGYNYCQCIVVQYILTVFL